MEIKVDVRVPDHRAILDADILVGLVDLLDLLHTLVQRLLRPEYSSVGLHGLLEVQPDLGGGDGAVSLPVKTLARRVSYYEDLILT